MNDESHAKPGSSPGIALMLPGHRGIHPGDEIKQSPHKSKSKGERTAPRFFRKMLKTSFELPNDRKFFEKEQPN